MTKLTTHVLDIYSGKPGKGIKVDLYYVVNEKKEKLNSIILNNDGRADYALIDGTNFKKGQYELVFFVGDYFKKITDVPEIPFLDDVVIKFGISNTKRTLSCAFTCFTLELFYLSRKLNDFQHY